MKGKVTLMTKENRAPAPASCYVHSSLGYRLAKDFTRNKYKYLIILPVLIYLILFCYKPMYGIIIAFKDYRPSISIAESKWAGLKYFKMYFNDPNFVRTFRNTFLLGTGSIIFGFPVPIIFALLLNEVRNMRFRKVIQTVTYLPHFISLVVVCSMIQMFCAHDGLITDFLVALGFERENLLSNPAYFRPIYFVSDIWQSFGWNSVIYLAAITSIDQTLYEAVEIDGGGRWSKMWNVTIPAIKPQIMILLILSTGKILGASFEKILNLYSPLTYPVADVISTYTYRMGLVNGNYSFATAVGLFNSLVNVTILLISNAISKKVSRVGLF